MILFTGPGLFRKHNHTEDRPGIFDLLVPQFTRQLIVQPICLVVYDCPARDELLESIIVGEPSNHATVTRQHGSDTLSINNLALSFQTKYETDIWCALINDLLSASPSRYDQLVSESIPKGYRTHMKMIESSFSSEHCSDLNQKCLDSMRYLTNRLSNCRCSNNIDLEMEDTVFDTMSQLTALVKK